jgi:hypothetical protein
MTLNAKDFQQGNAHANSPFAQSSFHADSFSPEISRAVDVGHSTRRRPTVALLCISNLSSIVDKTADQNKAEPKTHPIPAEKLYSAVVRDPDIETEPGMPWANPSSMRTLVDAAEYVSAQDAQPATASIIAAQLDPASEELFITDGMDPLASDERDNTTVDPRTLSHPHPRYLFSDRPEFRPGGKNLMISGVEERRLRREGGDRLFDS